MVVDRAAIRASPAMALMYKMKAARPLASLRRTWESEPTTLAEHSALIGALQYAPANGYDGIATAYADSELMVRQTDRSLQGKESRPATTVQRGEGTGISKLKSFSIHQRAAGTKPRSRPAGQSGDGWGGDGERKPSREASSRSR